ncbi:ankyrin repeat domain-containing protein [Pseudoxanthomonas sp. UC19_8]|uniref:ankyrin repeat domain-containing protein n=1 Tax=Pseudoxanthomonas sp. UC19_8 TaxID=3350175 RepID=UPI0036D23747
MSRLRLPRGPLRTLLLLLPPVLLAVCGCVYVALSLPRNANHVLDPDAYFTGPGLALARAVDHLDTHRIDQLVREQGLDPNTVFDRSGRPLLAWPVLTANPKGLKLLLDAGASPNVRGQAGTAAAFESALVPAAERSDPDYLTELLMRGGDPNTRNAEGQPLLYVAFKHGRWANVQHLILSGANQDTVLDGADHYDTVLSWYARSGRFDRLYWLLEHGGDPTMRMHDLEGARLLGTAQSNDGRMPIVEDAFYRDVPEAMRDWQRACQAWLLDKGIGRPPIPPTLRPRQRDPLPSDQEAGPGSIAL